MPYLHYISNPVRLENEHIGNTDQYRVTREVPLPYRVEEKENEDSDDEREEEERSQRSSWRRRPTLSVPLSRMSIDHTSPVPARATEA